MSEQKKESLGSMLLDIMDENDDIHNVWHNWDEPEN